jgi:hypothetical protein
MSLRLFVLNFRSQSCLLAKHRPYRVCAGLPASPISCDLKKIKLKNISKYRAKYLLSVRVRVFRHLLVSVTLALFYFNIIYDYFNLFYIPPQNSGQDFAPSQ